MQICLKIAALSVLGIHKNKDLLWYSLPDPLAFTY